MKELKLTVIFYSKLALTYCTYHILYNYVKPSISVDGKELISLHKEINFSVVCDIEILGDVAVVSCTS